MKRCVPPELKAAAEAAQQRKEAAIERLRSVAVETGALEEPPDEFVRRMVDLIDADKNVIQLRRRA